MTTIATSSDRMRATSRHRTTSAELAKSEANELVVTIKYLVAGGVAGAVSRTVVSPFERAKILIQVSATGNAGVSDTIKRMYQTDGFAGFFKGNGINILRMIPYTGIQISAYESYKRVFSSDEAELSSPLRLTSGALAGMTAAVLTYPLDIIRTRMTLYSIADTSSVVSGTGLGSGGALVAPTRYNSVYDCGQKIMYESGDYAGRSVTELKRNGQKGSPAMLFRGLTPSMLGVMPYVALNFALYEVLKVSAGTLSGADPHAEMGVGTRLTCAALAGALSQTVTYPLDVIKRRMQVMEMSSSRYHYTGVLDAFKTIKRSESWRGLYRGLLANYIKVVPSITASYFTYEYCKRLLLV